VFERLARAVLAHRIITALALVAAVGVTLSGLQHLTADFSLMAFFAGDDPEVDYLREHQEIWGTEESILLIVATADGSLVTPERIRAIEALDRAIAKDPNVERVVSLATAARLRGDGQMIEVSGVADVMPDDPDDFARFAQTLLEDQIFVPTFLAEDGTATSLLVELAVNADDVGEVIEAVLAVREIMQAHQGQAGLQLVSAGVPAIRADFFISLVEENKVNLPALALLCSLLLALILRRVHGVIVPLAAAGIPTLMTFGAMGWTGEQIGVVNQNYFSVLPVLAIADAIHMVSRFHEEIRRRARPGEVIDASLRREAIVDAVRHIGAACMLTSLTTGVGFLSLYVAKMPILRNYGVYAAVGIAFAYGTVLLIVPLLLSFTRGSVPEAGRPDSPTAGDRVLLACANFATHRSGTVLLITAAVVAGSVWLGTKVVVDNVLTRLLSDDHPTNIATVIADRKLAGVLAAEIAFEGEEVLEQDALQRLLALETWLKQQPEVRSIASVAGYVATLSEIVGEGYGVPDADDKIAQLLLLAEGDGGMDQILSHDGKAMRALVRVRDDGGRAFDEFSLRLDAEAKRRFEGSSVTPHLTGTAYVAYRGTNNVTEDLRDSLLVAFMAIGLIIALLFRSIRVTLICFVPNALPLLMGYALMGALGWLLDPSPAIVFTMALGIAVDDTIHLMVRYREELAVGKSKNEAVREAVLHSGRAVATTTIILGVGFLVSATSAFHAMAVAGGLGAMVIFTALIADVFVLPALLVRYG